MSRKEPKTLRVAGLRPFLPQTVPRTVCRFADRRELKDGRRTTMTAGMSYQVSDFGDSPHRSSSETGAKLFIVD